MVIGCALRIEKSLLYLKLCLFSNFILYVVQWLVGRAKRSRISWPSSKRNQKVKLCPVQIARNITVLYLSIIGIFNGSFIENQRKKENEGNYKNDWGKQREKREKGVGLYSLVLFYHILLYDWGSQTVYYVSEMFCVDTLLECTHIEQVDAVWPLQHAVLHRPQS